MTFDGLVVMILDVIDSLVYFVFAITFVFFVYQILSMWVFKGGDEQGIRDGKQILVATIVGLVVMSGIWGILALLRAGIFGA